MGVLLIDGSCKIGERTPNVADESTVKKDIVLVALETDLLVYLLILLGLEASSFGLVKLVLVLDILPIRQHLCEQIVLLQPSFDTILNQLLVLNEGIWLFLEQLFLLVKSLLELFPFCLVLLDKVFMLKESVVWSQLEHDS